MVLGGKVGGTRVDEIIRRMLGERIFRHQLLSFGKNVQILKDIVLKDTLIIHLARTLKSAVPTVPKRL